MELLLNRTKLFDNRTIGQLYIDGDFFCFTLEDKVREIKDRPVSEWKIKGETAIPEGRYPVTLESSPRFGPDTISLHRVPGFSYIRVHSGNTEKDTEGCPIVGYALTENDIIKPGTTKPAVRDLKDRIKKAIEKEETIFLTVKAQ